MREPTSTQSTRFAIIGAGSAGLTAARTLVEHGHRDVTVIEVADTVGGKCLSRSIDGRAYDLGAVLGTRWDSRELLKLARRHGLTVDDTYAPDFPPGKRESRLPRMRTAFELLKFVALAGISWRGIRAGEMSGLSEDLCDNFAEVAERRGLGNAEVRLRPLYTAMGYGVAQTLPMAYLVNFLNVRTFSSVLCFGCFGIREGFQEVWIREARALAQEGVRFLYGAQTTRVQRSHQVDITLRDGRHIQCEKLIIACDPRGIGLDATETERDLFAQTQNEDYRVLLCRIEGFPEANMPTHYYVEKSIDAARAGRAMVFYRKFPDTDVYTAYLYGHGRTRGETELQLENDVSELGGKFLEHLDYRAWNYFPHFSTTALKHGALDTLTRIQGDHHTVYAGEWADFGRLSRTIANARLNVLRLLGEDPSVTANVTASPFVHKPSEI